MNILAEFDFSFLIYLIAGAFWLFSSLVQRKSNKRRAAEMRKKREEREREERRTGKKTKPEAPEAPKPQSDLDTFLRELTGQQLPQKAPPPPPIPKRKVLSPEIKFKGPPPSPPTASASSPAIANLPEKAKASKNYDIGELDMEASFKQISDIKDAAELIHGDIDQKLQAEALKSVRSMMIDLSSSSVAVPSIHLQSIRAIRTETSRPNFKKKNAFKKALVASVILEAPKALRENPFTEIV